MSVLFQKLQILGSFLEMLTTYNEMNFKQVILTLITTSLRRRPETKRVWSTICLLKILFQIYIEITGSTGIVGSLSRI